MLLGIDVSTYIEEKNAGARYLDNGKEFDPLQTFRDNGISLMRIRIWNNPFDENGKPYLGGTNDLNQALNLIKEGDKYGYQYLIDLHYSDFWADPGKQCLPKEWVGLSFEEIYQKVYSFTKETLSEIKKVKEDIPFIQIGNEVTNGMLWPYGQLVFDENNKLVDYKGFLKLLSSGIKASREIYPNAKIIIHLESSNKYQVYQEIFSKIAEERLDYDIIGMSYYPYWHGTFDELFYNVNLCQKAFKKDVMICELGYGFTLEDYIFTSNGKSELKVSRETLDAKLPYEISIEGQALFIEDFLKRCQNNNVAGVIYWEPLWIPGEQICWASPKGQEYIGEPGKPTRNEWSNQCLVDYTGQKLPGFDKFKLQ